MEAWLLRCEEKGQNIVAVLKDGLKSGAIAIPGPSPLSGLKSVTDYLNAFGVAVAERIKSLFVPLFDPAKDLLSREVMAVNQYVHDLAGYSLYDAQLAGAEAAKRRSSAARPGFVAECGSGKSVTRA